MAHVQIQPHADGVRRHQIIDLAFLKHAHLRIAGGRGQRAHHHRRAAREAPQHFGHGIDLFHREGDDGAATRQAGQLLRTGIAQRGKTRAGDDLGFRQQLPDHRAQHVRSQDHRFLAATRAQQTIGKHMPTLGIGAQLRLIQRHEAQLLVERHGFRGAQIPARIGRFDLLLAGDQRHPVRALHRADPVIHLARQQTQRKADHAGRMRGQPLDRQMGLAGVGGAKDGGDRGKVGHGAVAQDRRIGAQLQAEPNAGLYRRRPFRFPLSGACAQRPGARSWRFAAS